MRALAKSSSFSLAAANSAIALWPAGQHEMVELGPPPPSPNGRHKLGGGDADGCPSDAETPSSYNGH